MSDRTDSRGWYRGPADALIARHGKLPRWVSMPHTRIYLDTGKVIYRCAPQKLTPNHVLDLALLVADGWDIAIFPAANGRIDLSITKPGDTK